MLVISDTSALSALAEIHLLPMLPALVGQVTITQSVQRECQNAGAPAALQAWMAMPPPWLLVVPDPAALLTETSALGIGEASAITLAWQHRQESLLILDEKRGRKIARALELPMVGVLALLTDGAKAGLADFEEAIRNLKKAKFWIAEGLVEMARRSLR